MIYVMLINFSIDGICKALRSLFGILTEGRVKLMICFLLRFVAGW
jgi:hypothetical protein